MLTRVDVQSENPFFLNIRDARPTDSIIVEKIEGLGPPDIDLFMGDYARDGGYYSGRRVPPRDVSFMLRYNPNYELNETVSGLRQLLYKSFLDPFPSADGLSIILHDDEAVDRYFMGYTNKFEGDLFSDDTTALISMRCPNPYIIDSASTQIAAAGPTVPFEYSGTAEVGLTIEATLTTSSSWLQFQLGAKTMILNLAFLAGDKVVVDTRQGSRKIQLIRAGLTYDILYTLYSSPSSWLEIHGKSNTLKSWGINSDTVVANITRITFQAYHWGI